MKEHGVIALIKKHVLTAIGYMIPLVVAAGLCMALGQFIDSDVRNSTSGIGYYLYKAGGFGMSAVVPVIYLYGNQGWFYWWYCRRFPGRISCAGG